MGWFFKHSFRWGLTSTLGLTNVLMEVVNFLQFWVMYNLEIQGFLSQFKDFFSLQIQLLHIRCLWSSPTRETFLSGGGLDQRHPMWSGCICRLALFEALSKFKDFSRQSIKFKGFSILYEPCSFVLPSHLSSEDPEKRKTSWQRYKHKRSRMTFPDHPAAKEKLKRSWNYKQTTSQTSLVNLKKKSQALLVPWALCLESLGTSTDLLVPQVKYLAKTLQDLARSWKILTRFSTWEWQLCPLATMIDKLFYCSNKCHMHVTYLRKSGNQFQDVVL